MGKQRTTQAKGNNSHTRRQSSRRLARLELAMRLYLRGRSYSQIAKEMRISKATAWRYVHDAIDRSVERAITDADKWRALELQKLERAERLVLSSIAALQDAREGLPDSAMDMTAAHDGRQVRALVSALVDLSARRSSLLGMDAPVKVEHAADPDTIGEAISLAQALAGDGDG